MKAGFQDFFTTVTALTSSGSSMTYSPTGAWTINSYVSGISGNTGSVYSISNLNGAYRINLYVGLGNGAFDVSNTDSKAIIIPKFFTYEGTNYSIDETYAQVALYRDSVDVNPLGTAYYESQELTLKEKDAIDFTYLIPSAITSSISGWSNFSAQLRSETAAISSNTTVLGQLSVTPSYSANSVKITGASTFFAGTIPYPRRSVKAYIDLIANNPDGLKQTIAEFDLTVQRSY